MHVSRVFRKKRSRYSRSTADLRNISPSDFNRVLMQHFSFFGLQSGLKKVRSL